MPIKSCTKHIDHEGITVLTVEYEKDPVKIKAYFDKQKSEPIPKWVEDICNEMKELYPELCASLSRR